jgi:hypothetical protein
MKGTTGVPLIIIKHTSYKSSQIYRKRKIEWWFPGPLVERKGELLFNDTESDLQGKKALKLGYTTK